MPDYTGGNIIGDRAASFRRYTEGVIGQVDRFGAKHYVRLRANGADMTRGELDGLRQAIGDASNAGVFFDGIEDFHQTSPSDARAINDSLGTVSTVAVFVFEREDNVQLKETVEVGAPKVEMLVRGEDEYFVDTESAMAQAIITASQNCFNSLLPDGEPEYVFRRAYLSDRKRKKVGGKEIPNVVDPVI